MDSKILYYDVETTGLSTYTSKIITISFHLDGKNSTIIVNPGIPIPLESSRVHGIYDKDVEGLKTFDFYAKKIFNLLNSVDVICGYNIRKFDNAILQTELLRCGYEIPKHVTTIDVYEIVQSLFKSHKLSDIYRVLLKKELTNAHDSHFDVMATKEIYEYIKKEYL